MNRCLLASLERSTCSASNIHFNLFFFLGFTTGRACIRLLLSFLQQLYVSGVCFNPFIHTHTHTLAHTQHRAVYQASLIPILPSSLFRTFRLLLSRCFSSLYLSLPLHKLVFWLLRSRIPPSTCLEVVVVVALLLGPITLQSEFGSFLCHFWHLNWFILFICHQHPPLSNPPKKPYFSDIILLVAITICHGAMAHGEGCDK